MTITLLLLASLQVEDVMVVLHQLELIGDIAELAYEVNSLSILQL